MSYRKLLKRGLNNKPQGKKHRDPGAVQRAIKKEAAERKKDAAFAKKHGLTKKQKTLPKALQSKIIKSKKKK